MIFALIIVVLALLMVAAAVFTKKQSNVTSDVVISEGNGMGSWYWETLWAEKSNRFARPDACRRRSKYLNRSIDFNGSDVLLNIELSFGLEPGTIKARVLDMNKKYEDRNECCSIETNIIGAFVAGGAVANMMFQMAGNLPDAPMNDIDLYVFLDGADNDSYLRPHEVEDASRMTSHQGYNGEIIRDVLNYKRSYKVMTATSDWVHPCINVIYCTTNDGKMPSIENLITSFDLNICQAGIDLKDDKLVFSNSVKNTVHGYTYNVNIKSYATPIQSCIRVCKKAVDMYLEIGNLDRMMEEVYREWYAYVTKYQHQYFGTKYAEMWNEFPELHKYFSVEQAPNGAFEAVWVPWFENKCIENMLKEYVFGHGHVPKTKDEVHTINVKNAPWCDGTYTKD